MIGNDKIGFSAYGQLSNDSKWRLPSRLLSRSTPRRDPPPQLPARFREGRVYARVHDLALGAQRVATPRIEDVGQIRKNIRNSSYHNTASLQQDSIEWCYFLRLVFWKQEAVMVWAITKLKARPRSKFAFQSTPDLILKLWARIWIPMVDRTEAGHNSHPSSKQRLGAYFEPYFPKLPASVRFQNNIE
ncbi:hypothetical protein BDV93DRAFT_513942 [Ceratobasidium sp. AG-I]|nr:hypothetical protein BDV93DRAFT_513942 [Ceratobasidium sp. AG-I]